LDRTIITTVSLMTPHLRQRLKSKGNSIHNERISVLR
jgi:hypothetical protein